MRPDDCKTQPRCSTGFPENNHRLRFPQLTAPPDRRGRVSGNTRCCLQHEESQMPITKPKSTPSRSARKTPTPKNSPAKKRATNSKVAALARPSSLKSAPVYTRKSTEHGLELEFNSLDAQRDASAPDAMRTSPSSGTSHRS